MSVKAVIWDTLMASLAAIMAAFDVSRGHYGHATFFALMFVGTVIDTAARRIVAASTPKRVTYAPDGIRVNGTMSKAEADAFIAEWMRRYGR